MLVAQVLDTAWSMASPPTGMRSAVTMDPSESTATCVVAAPQTMIMVAVGLFDGEPAADGGGDQGVDELDPARAEPDERLDGGALGQRVASCGVQAAARSRGLRRSGAAELVAEQMAQHPLGHLDVDDGAAGDGAGDPDVVGGTACHLLGEGSDGDERTGPGVHRGDARLVDDETGSLHKDPGSGGPQVDGDVAAAQLLKTDGHAGVLPRALRWFTGGRRALFASCVEGPRHARWTTPVGCTKLTARQKA